MKKIKNRAISVDCCSGFCPTFEFSTDALFYHNRDGIILVNSAGIKMLGGKSIRQFKRKQFTSFLHENDQRAFNIRWQMVNTKNRSLTGQEGRLIRLDGKEVYVNISLSSFMAKGDRFILITCHDITDRKKVEKALRNNEEIFKSMVQNVNGYIYNSRYKAGKLIFVYHSPKCLDITGYSPEEYHQDPDLWLKMVYHLDREYVINFFENLSPDTLQKTLEHRIVHKDGIIRWISNTFTAQFNKRGRITRMDGFIVDITERKKDEKALHGQYLFLQKLIDTIPNPVFYKDKNGCYRGINSAFEGFFGLSREMVTGRTPYEIFPEKLADVLHKMDLALLKKPINQQFEIQLLSSDKIKHDVMINKAVYKDSEGRLGGFVGVIIDVTRLKQIQSELRNTLAKLKEMEAIINISPVVVFLWRAEESWPVEFVSENVNQFGYNSEEFISGKLFYSDIIYPADLRKVIYDVNKYAVDDVKEFTLNYRIHTKSREIRWVEDRTWFRKNRQGKVTHHQGIIVDITEKKKAEQMLKESEERYRTLAENSYDLICEVNNDSRFIYTSPNFYDLLGYENGELEGKSIFELVHIDDMPVVLVELKKEYGRATLRLKHKNGEWRWFESAGKRFKTASGVLKGVIVSRDITERKHFESQVIQTEKLMAVGEMAAMIAHEFRNALTSIKMILQLQIESPNLNKNEVKSFNVAINSIYHMEEVVQQLLNFAHPAPMSLHIEDLNSILNDCLPFIQMECNKKSIHFIKKFDQSLPPILVHSASIKEAIINLLLNATQAFEFSNKLRRRISLFTRKVILNETLRDFDFGIRENQFKLREKTPDRKEILLKEGTECILIEITDNGSGIEETTFPRIFEPFYTTKDKGSGLGLPIVKRTVNAHGGIIVVESNKNAGTIFRIYLPFKRG